MAKKKKCDVTKLQLWLAIVALALVVLQIFGGFELVWGGSVLTLTDVAVILLAVIFIATRKK